MLGIHQLKQKEKDKEISICRELIFQPGEKAAEKNRVVNKLCNVLEINMCLGGEKKKEFNRVKEIKSARLACVRPSYPSIGCVCLLLTPTF